MVSLEALTFSTLQLGTFACLVVAVRRGKTAAALNAVGSFGLALLPVVAAIGLPVVLPRSVSLGWVLPVWLAAAGLLHSLGMLGWYESTWWWDHLTHTVSASLVAALLYAGVLVALPAPGGVERSSGFVLAVTVGFTLAIGILWELIELGARELGERFDIEPVLVHYGWRDTALDLVFDVVGALLVVGTDLRVFVSVMKHSPGDTAAVLLGIALAVGVGSVALACYVGFERSIAT